MIFAAADASDNAYNGAWMGVGLVFIYYVAAAAILHWSSRRPISTKYEPPANTSPAMAAHLLENGRSERAFASALASLAVQGFLEIRQRGDWFTLKRLREPDDNLAPEESTALAELFPYGNDIYKFDERDNSRLCFAFRKFKDVLKDEADPRFLSSHREYWWIGIACLVLLAMRLALSLSFSASLISLGSIAYASVWSVLGGYSLIAALRAWPATLRRIATLLPFRTGPRHPLSWIDLQPLWLSATAMLAFGFLASIASPRFAAFVVACALLAFTFGSVLESPTSEGRRLICDLMGFREFLARAESDRLNRNNEVGLTPKHLERYTAYAVALDVEHSWGEEFTEDLIEIIQFGRVLEIQELPLPDDWPRHEGADLGDSVLQLRLGSKK